MVTNRSTETVATPVDNFDLSDSDECLVADALKLVEELHTLGVERARYDLESPYSRRTLCSSQEG